MTRRVRGAIAGYLTLAATYVVGVLLAWVAIDEAPFRPDGGLTTNWGVALLVITVLASVGAGWVGRSVGGDRVAVIGLVAVLLGLALAVVVTDVMVGPSPSAREFVERLFGPLPADYPFASLLDGRPGRWFSLGSYLLSVASIGIGAAISERRSDGADSRT